MQAILLLFLVYSFKISDKWKKGKGMATKEFCKKYLAKFKRRKIRKVETHDQEKGFEKIVTKPLFFRRTRGRIRGKVRDK